MGWGKERQDKMGWEKEREGVEARSGKKEVRYWRMTPGDSFSRLSHLQQDLQHGQICINLIVSPSIEEIRDPRECEVGGGNGHFIFAVWHQNLSFLEFNFRLYIFFSFLIFFFSSCGHFGRRSIPFSPPCSGTTLPFPLPPPSLPLTPPQFSRFSSFFPLVVVGVGAENVSPPSRIPPHSSPTERNPKKTSKIYEGQEVGVKVEGRKRGKREK